MSQKKFLIVDDDGDYAGSVSDAAAGMGYGTFVAHDAETAFKLYVREHPEIVLTDFQIGRDNGCALAMRIREYERLMGANPARIILMSGDDAVDASAWRDAGIDGFYPKVAGDIGLLERTIGVSQ